MSHDIEASWAASELARMFEDAPSHCFANVPSGSFDARAARASRDRWPLSDGLIEVGVTDAPSPRVAHSVGLEFKRLNEGLHGLLTALGQGHAYLHKGYKGAAICVPDAYPGLQTSGGAYVANVIASTSNALRLGVFGYSDPDRGALEPFRGRISMYRRIELDSPPINIPAQIKVEATETQWAHMREGSSEPDAFFRFLQCVKTQGDGPEASHPLLPIPLLDAINRIRAGTDPYRYLSSAPRDDVFDRAWRKFWFKYIFSNGVEVPWVLQNGIYLVNAAKLGIVDFTGNKKEFFSGRADSLKEKIVQKLNNGEINEFEAWELFAQKVKERAHSFREDIDSGVEHLGLITAEGRLTNLGFRFVELAELHGGANNGPPLALFKFSLLTEGGYAALLHYINKLSERELSNDGLAFCSTNVRGRPVFDTERYKTWLEERMAEELRVLKKASLRGGQSRKPLQAELAILGNLGLIKKSRARFRVGVGLVIDWPSVYGAMNVDN